jgi:membrane protease YdiL (CAAX protease family)
MKFRSGLTVVYRCAGAALAVAAANALIEFARLVNLGITGPAVPWFILPALGIALATLRWCDEGYHAESAIQVTRRRATTMALLFGAGLAALGLALRYSLGTGRAGQVAMPGDNASTALVLFRVLTSFTINLTAGPIEEGCLRGLVQLGLQRTIGRWSEIIAGIEFILIHGRRLTNPAELLLVTFTAIALGRLTARTQSTRYAALAHCLCNFLITSVVTFVTFAGNAGAPA